MPVALEAAGIPSLPCLPNWPQFELTFAITPSLTNSGRLVVDYILCQDIYCPSPLASPYGKIILPAPFTATLIT